LFGALESNLKGNRGEVILWMRWENKRIKPDKEILKNHHTFDIRQLKKHKF
jgi:hypothetical protein